jgi:biopolymer transport protein ExbB/TolQ
MNLILITITLFLISIIIVFFIFKKFKTLEKQNLLTNNIQCLINDIKKDKNKLKYLLKIKKLENNSIPWYMKGISTVGVIAFFSMILATLIQTIELTSKNSELIDIENKYKKTLDSQKKLESIINNTVENLYEQAIKGKKITNENKKLIKYRISKILNSSQSDYATVYRLSMIIDDYEQALDSVTKIDKDSTNIHDVISLAEYSYMQGRIKDTRVLIKEKELYKNISTLSSSWALKVLVLMTLVDNDDNNYIAEISKELQLPRHEAKIWLKEKQKKLKR